MDDSSHNIGQELLVSCRLLDLEPEAVLMEIGLENFSGDYSALCVTPRQVDAVYDALGKLSGQDDFHIKIAQGFANGGFSKIMLAMQCSETLREAFVSGGRFKELFEPVEWKVVESEQCISIHVRSRTPDYRFGVNAQIMTFLTLVQLSRNITMQPISPRRVCVTEAFKLGRRVEQEMGCPIELAERAFVEFDASVGDVRVLSANPAVIQALDETAQQQQSAVGQRFSDAVRVSVQELLPSGVMTSDRVARRLAVSKRTLERRLAEEGCSFTQLVRECRMKLADHHLTRTDMSLAEIAFMLGYRDVNSFHRAFKGWRGKTATEVRQRA